MRPLPITSLTDAPAFVLGVSLVRGAPTPVVSLGALLGITRDEEGALPATAGEGSARFVVVAPDAVTRERRVALLVAKVEGVVVPHADELAALPPLLSQANPGAVAQLASLEQGLVFVLEATSLVPAELAALWAATDEARA